VSAQLPIGAEGELCIGGAGVTRGYWRRPDLTAERFVVNPFEPERHDMLYRTGDLVRYRDSGEIEREIGTFARSPADGLIVTSGPLAAVHRDLIIQAAARHRLPAVAQAPACRQIFPVRAADLLRRRQGRLALSC